MKYQLIYLSNLNKIIININLYYGHVFTIKKKSRSYEDEERRGERRTVL